MITCFFVLTSSFFILIARQKLLSYFGFSRTFHVLTCPRIFSMITCFFVLTSSFFIFVFRILTYISCFDVSHVYSRWSHVSSSSLLVSSYSLLKQIYFRISDPNVHFRFWRVHVYSRWSHVSSSSLQHFTVSHTAGKSIAMATGRAPQLLTQVPKPMVQKLNILWTFPCIQ